MMRQRREYIIMSGMLAIMLVALVGCTEPPMFIQQALGRGIADHREAAKYQYCPQITTFTVSPSTVKCGGSVTLEIAATTPIGAPLTYSWDIEGQTFQTGQQAVWKTPTSETIGEPEKVFTVRGIVSDGECSITQSVDVMVLCMTAFDSMVNFEFGKADLDSTARIELDEIAEKLLQNPTHALLIEGHTDYVGTEPANERLGERRAEAVRQYLSKTWNIDPDRIITRSFGEQEPIAPNELDAGRAKNRRAEIFRMILSTKSEPVQESDLGSVETFPTITK